MKLFTKIFLLLMIFSLSATVVSAQGSMIPDLNSDKASAEIAQLQQMHGPTYDVPPSQGGDKAVGDDCSNPIMFSIGIGDTYSETGMTNCGSGNNYSNTDMGNYDGGEDIIYEFTVTEGANVNFLFSPSATYAAIGLFNACPDVTGSLITGWTNGFSGGPIEFSEALAPGTYYLMMDTWPTPDCITSFDLEVTASAVTTGDACFAPFTYGNVNDAAVNASTTAAGDADWYMVTATSDLMTSVSLCGSAFDTKLEVWTDCGTFLDENDDYCGSQSQIDDIPILAGESVYVKVLGYGSNFGDYTLEVTGVDMVPKMNITPDPLSLGEWPIGGWQEMDYFTLTNAGFLDIEVTSSDLDDDNDVFVLSNPALPATIAPAATEMVGVAFVGDGVAAGTYDATYVASFGLGKAVATTTVSVDAYVADLGDIVENPFMVNALPYTDAGRSSAFPMRSNYNLPGTATNGKDVVYMFSLDTDQEVDVTISNATETPKMAIYAAGFESEGGPMVSNAVATAGTSAMGLPLFAGDYYLVVAAEADNAAMTFDLEITSTTMPAPECILNDVNLFPADGQVEVPSNNITLEWAFGQYAQEYQIVYGLDYPPTDSISDWMPAGAAGTIGTFDLPNLDPSMQYFWRINLKNNNATVENCDIFGFTTTLTPPSTLSAVVDTIADDKYNVDLQWGSSEKALTDYIIYRDDVEIATVTAGTTTYTDEDVAYNQTAPCYKYQVAALFDEGLSAKSLPAYACIPGSGSLSGLVTEFNNPTQAISGATVTLVPEYSGHDPYTTHTDIVGEYSFDVVLEGDYTIRVSAEGFLPEEETGVTVEWEQETANKDFQLMEFPYAVADVVATQLNDNTVQVDWGGNGGGSSVAEWIFYDDATYSNALQWTSGVPITWAIQFTPAQMADFIDCSVTKFQYFSVETPAVTFKVWQGDNAETLIGSEDVTGLTTGNAWNEVELTTPIPFDNTQTLWIGFTASYPNLNEFPATISTATGIPGAQMIQFSDGTWDNMEAAYPTFPTYHGAWMTRAFITDATGKTFDPSVSIVEYFKNNPNNSLTAQSATAQAIPAPIDKHATSGTKSLQGYNVYRQVCNEATAVEFLGMTIDDQFTDNTWGDVEWGTYKWAVEAIYQPAGNLSELAYSNCLPKDMYAVVGVEVTTNSGDSPEDCAITFTNTSEPELALVYDVELDATGMATWDEFRKGTYDYTVELAGFEPITGTAVLVDMDTTFVWQLDELLAPPTDLYVTPTGFATWNMGGFVPFVPDVESFETGDFSAFPWQMDANGWYIVGTAEAYDGNYGSRSVDIDNSELATMSLDYTVEAEGGFISFYYKVSSENNWDFFNFYINGVEQDSWSGEIDWTMASYNLEPGDYTFTWEYDKDGSLSAGDDCAWVDLISFPVPGGKTAADKSFQFFKVWHDGTFIVDQDTTFYQYGDNGEDLVPGASYVAEVAALFSTGLSTKEDYTWTYLPCDSFPGPQVMEAYNVEGSDDVVILWGDEFAGGGADMMEDFEGGVTPDGWEVIQTNTVASGPTPAYWTVNDYSSADFGPIGTYHAGLWWDFGAQDEWLSTPEMPCGANTTLEFSTAVYEGSTNLDHYYVKVSTDGGSNWDIVWDASALTGNAWNYYSYPYTIDLSAYAGENIKIAFNAVDGDGAGLWYVWFIDNVTVSSSKGSFSFNGNELENVSYSQNASNKSNASHAKDGKVYPILTANKAAKAAPVVIGTNVYRDGEMIAYVPAPDTFYLDMNLEPGYYDYCVASVYSEDEGAHSWTSCTDANCELDVLIPEDCTPPSNLTAEDLTGDGHTATLNWQFSVNGSGEFFEDFESGALPTGWAAYDVDGDGYNWTNSSNFVGTFNAHSGEYVMCSESWDGVTGNPLTPDNYLVTPAIVVSSTSELSFWYVGQDPAWASEVFHVLISTTGNTPADFTTEIGDGVASATYQEMLIDLSAYAGETVYIAIQHTDVSDMFILNIDDVKVTNTVSKAAFTPSVEPTNTQKMPIKTAGMTAVQIDEALAKYEANFVAGSKVLEGTNVYRDGEMIAFVPSPATTYADLLDEAGYHCYEVTGVYSVCGESDPSNEACVDVSVGINNVENTVSVYPNPATDFVMVEASQDIRSIEVTNYMGQVVSAVKAVEATQYQVNTSDLSSGIYFIEVETAAGIEKVRIVISE